MGDDEDGGRVGALCGSPGGGHQGQLVRGKCPGDAVRHDDGDAGRHPVGKVRQDLLEVLRSGVPVEGHAVLEWRHRLGADRDDQDVVFQRGPVGKIDLVVFCSDPPDACVDEAGVVILAQPRERIARRVTESERLPRGQWPVSEAVGCRHQRDVEPTAGSPAKSDHRLESGDTASSDDDANWVLACGVKRRHRTTMPIRGVRHIRGVPSFCCGILRSGPRSPRCSS
jgi:hypothetical protein